MAVSSRERLTLYGQLLALLGATLGFIALLGQLLDVPALATFLPGRPVVQPVAAIATVLSGLAVFWAACARVSRAARVLSMAMAGAVFVVMALTAAEYLLGVDLAVDRALPTTLDDGGPFPGRASPLSTIALLLLSGAVLLFDVRSPRGVRPREWLALSTLLLGFVALVGHLYGVSALYEADPRPLRGVALPGALSLISIASAAFLVRSREGTMRLVTSEGPGGVLLRRLGTTSVLAFPILGGILLVGVEMIGLRDIALIAGLGTVAGVSVSIFLLAVTASALERAYEAEQKSRRHIEQLLEQAPMGVFIADLDGRYREVNPAGARLLEMEPGEIVGKTIMDIIPPGDVERLMRSRDRLLRGEVDVDRWELKKSDGSYATVEVTAKILPDGRWQGFVADVTHRIELESRLRASLAEQEFLSRAGVELASRLARAEALETIGGLAVQRIGDVCGIDMVEDEAVRRSSLTSRVPLDDETRAVLSECTVETGGDHPLLTVLESKRGVIFSELDDALIEIFATGPEHLRALRRIGLHTLMIVPMIARGEMIATMCIGSCDPTHTFRESDLRLAEELATRGGLTLDNVRLFQESQLQAAMITNLAEGILLIRAEDRRIVYTNPRFDEMLGYEPGELIGQPVHVINAPTELSPAARAEEIIREIEREGGWHGEVLNQRKNGTTMWNAASVSTYEHEEFGRVLMSAHTDIDERKRLEEDAERALMEKEILLKEVHHRVKNNLQVITSLFSLQSARAESEDLRAMLDESRMRIQSIALVHEQLYRSSDLAVVDFDEYLRGLVAAIRTSYGAENVTIETRATDVVLDIEEAVPSALILAELLSNALKHAFERGRPGHVWVTAHRDAHDRCVLEVADDGVGIPEDFDWTEVRSLGLRIVRDLTRQLRGEVTLDRAGGTRFTIRFPLRHAARRLDERARLEA